MVLVQDGDQSVIRNFNFPLRTGKNRADQTLCLQIDICKQQSMEELAARVMEYHKIPCFVEQDLRSALCAFTEAERQKLSDQTAGFMIEKFKQKPEIMGKINKSCAEKYQKNWTEFTKQANQDVNEEFSMMYHKLIHSQAMIVLLPLEKHYYYEVSKLIKDKQQSMIKLRERQELEMQRACEHVGDVYSQLDVNKLASKHAEDSERILGQWKEKYSKLVQNQKSEYKGVISRLYNEMLANQGEVDECGHTYVEIKKIVEASAESVDMYSLSSETNMFGHHDANAGNKFKKRRDSQSSSDSPNITSSSSHDDWNLEHGLPPRMEESFTINLGAQMKTMHNIRLVVAPILHFCFHSNEGDAQAQRLQTVMSLYSNSLSGLVLFVDKNMDSKTRLKSEFAVVCKSSTEFHFPSLKEQLTEIKNRKLIMSSDRLSVKSADTLSTDSSSSDRSIKDNCFNDGDFYVTKHSNLSRVHVVFHLCSNVVEIGSAEFSPTVTSRHPVILGLRHILKIMSNHDIGTLTIPLLLCHELADRIDEAWVIKRAELVMKCMKGFMMEMATWDGGISRTIQFAVPPGIEDSTFDRLVSMLPEIFRTTSARVLASGVRRSVGSGSPRPSKKAN